MDERKPLSRGRRTRRHSRPPEILRRLWSVFGGSYGAGSRHPFACPPQPPAEWPQAPDDAPSDALDALDSLLRTNVQKSVRARIPEVASASVVHYLAQTMQVGAKQVNKRRGDLLARMPIVAAEDAGPVPTLAACILYDLAATSPAFGFDPSDALIVANCAASLAEVGRCKLTSSE